MEDTLVQFETAKLAKEKGFGWPTLNYQWTDKKFSQSVINSSSGGRLHIQSQWNEGSEITISIPTQSLLQKWLREKHQIIVLASLDQTSYPKYCPEIFKYKDFGNYQEVTIKDFALYKTYEEALEAGLLSALNLIQK